MKNKKLIGLTLVALLSAVSVLNVVPAFADTTTTTTKKEKPAKSENEITGKITSIDATSVTIAVATRKKMEKPADGQNGSTTTNETTTNGEAKKEKPNMDNMFTLTGETKTINISAATFGGGHKEKANESGTTTTETQKAKTYADYAVGDYISIEMTDATSLVAKTVRSAGMGGGGHKGGKDGKGGNGQQTQATN